MSSDTRLSRKGAGCGEEEAELRVAKTGATKQQRKGMMALYRAFLSLYTRVRIHAFLWGITIWEVPRGTKYSGSRKHNRSSYMMRKACSRAAANHGQNLYQQEFQRARGGSMAR